MRRKSKELLDMALRELHTAIKEVKEEVEITLEKDFDGTQKAAEHFSKKYETKKLTELIRKEFADYEVKSIIYGKPNYLAIVCFSNKSCTNAASYSLIWKLSLQEKKK